MPKIFEYLGILIFFYSNEHEPIHVHAKKAECESKAEFFIVDGKVVEIKISNLLGAKPLTGTDLADFQIFLSIYSEQIVQKWVDYFILKKKINFERITKKLK